MHSDLEQEKRDDVMLDFKAGRINVLVATDNCAFRTGGLCSSLDCTRRCRRQGRNFHFRKGERKIPQVESLLEAEVPKGTVPEELGETPSYTTRYGRTTENVINHGAKTAEGAHVPARRQEADEAHCF